MNRLFSSFLCSYYHFYLLVVKYMFAICLKNSATFSNPSHSPALTNLTAHRGSDCLMRQVRSGPASLGRAGSPSPRSTPLQ